MKNFADWNILYSKLQVMTIVLMNSAKNKMHIIY